MKFFNYISHFISKIGSFWQEKFNAQIFRWNLFFIVIQIALIFFKFSDLPLQVPLYYSLPWGESQLAPVSYLFILPLFSIIVLLLDSILAVFYLRSIDLLSRLLIVVSLVYSVFSSLALFHILKLVS